MGKIKALYASLIEKTHQDYIDRKLTFKEAYNKLCQMGLEPDYASDSLDIINQIELFPDSEQATFDGEPKYGETKFK